MKRSLTFVLIFTLSGSSGALAQTWSDKNPNKPYRTVKDDPPPSVDHQPKEVMPPAPRDAACLSAPDAEGVRHSAPCYNAKAVAEKRELQRQRGSASRLGIGFLVASGALFISAHRMAQHDETDPSITALGERRYVPLLNVVGVATAGLGVGFVITSRLTVAPAHKGVGASATVKW